MNPRDIVREHLEVLCQKHRIPRWLKELCWRRFTNGLQVYGEANHRDMPEGTYLKETLEEIVDAYMMAGPMRLARGEEPLAVDELAQALLAIAGAARKAAGK